MGIEYSIVQANKQSLPHLSNSMLLLVVGPFLIGTVVWTVILLRHFRRIH